MNRKAIYFLGGLLVLILIIAGILVFKNKGTNGSNNSQQTANQDGSNSGTDQSSGSAQSAVKISDTVVVAPSLSYTQDAVWYFTTDGHLYKVDLSSGLKKEYVLPSYLTVSDVIWPATGGDFIVVTDSQAAGRTFTYYDSIAKAFKQYAKNIQGVDFMPDGKHILYNWVADNGTSSLTMANADGSNHSPVMDLPDGSYTVKVSPSGDKALLYQDKTPSDGKLIFADLNNKSIATIKTGTNNAGLWSSDAQKFAFNKQSGDGTQLWIGDISSVNGDKSTGLQAAADQSFFDLGGKVLYTYSNNAIWKVNLDSMQTSKVFESNSSFQLNVKRILVTTSGMVLFQNSDGYLYLIHG